MRLYLDLDSRNFLESLSFPRALTTLELKRRDTDLIELQFLRDRTVQELPAGSTVQIGLKPATAYAADFLASGTFTKSGTGTSTKYLLDLNLNTTALAAAFSASATEPETLAAMAEIEWTTPTTISSSKTLGVTIANDVIRGDEGEPAEAPIFYIASTEDFRATQAEAETGADNAKWMTPLRTAQAIAELATSYNTAIADTVVSTPVGGAPAAAASTWKSKNLVEILDTILFPTIPARIGTPRSVTLTISGPSGDIEVGTSHSRTLTADFNRGTILNGDGTVNANPLVGPAVTHTFSGSGVLSQAENTLTFPAITRSGSNTWGVATTYSAGAGQYFDNKGVAGANLAAERVASTITDGLSAPTINGVYPYYYLKSATPITAASMAAAIQGGTATKVIAASTGTLSIPYAPSAEYFAVAYPSLSTTKTRYFVTAVDSGAITGVFAPVATQSVTTALWTTDYRIHCSTAALTNSNPTIELRNT